MRKSLGFALAFALTLPLLALAAQPDLNADLLWRSLNGAPQTSPPNAPTGLAPQNLSGFTATANCWNASPISCNGVSLCFSVDQNCPEQGYVSCDYQRIYCPEGCFDPCSQYSYSGCPYSWDSTAQCCVPHPIVGVCPDQCY